MGLKSAKPSGGAKKVDRLSTHPLHRPSFSYILIILTPSTSYPLCGRVIVLHHDGRRAVELEQPWLCEASGEEGGKARGGEGICRGARLHEALLDSCSPPPPDPQASQLSCLRDPPLLFNSNSCAAVPLPPHAPPIQPACTHLQPLVQHEVHTQQLEAILRDAGPQPGMSLLWKRGHVLEREAVQRNVGAHPFRPTLASLFLRTAAADSGMCKHVRRCGMISHLSPHTFMGPAAADSAALQIRRMARHRVPYRPPPHCSDSSSYRPLAGDELAVALPPLSPSSAFKLDLNLSRVHTRPLHTGARPGVWTVWQCVGGGGSP